jgi:hypothetical protein
MSRPNAARVICAGSGPPRDAGVEGVDRGELDVGEIEVEDVEVLLDPRRRHRLGDGLTALLQVPAQHHLGRCLGVGGRDLVDDRVRQGAAVGAVPVEGDAADRRPRLGQDPVLGVDRQELGLPKVGVHLDLVHSRHHRRGRQQR